MKIIPSVLSFIKDSWKSHMIGFIITGILLVIPDSWFISAAGYSIPSSWQLVILIFFILSVVLIIVDIISYIKQLKNQIALAEKQKNDNDIEYKRSLIVKWRNMINEVIKEKDEDENNIKAAVYLERHKDYYSLKPHLSKNTMRQLCRATKFTVGSTISPPLKFILDDIARIEKEWKLI